MDDGIRGRMARAPAIFAKGHIVAPAQIIYLKVLGNAVTAEVDLGAGNFTGFAANPGVMCPKGSWRVIHSGVSERTQGSSPRNSTAQNFKPVGSVPAGNEVVNQ